MATGAPATTSNYPVTPAIATELLCGAALLLGAVYASSRRVSVRESGNRPPILITGNWCPGTGPDQLVPDSVFTLVLYILLQQTLEIREPEIWLQIQKRLQIFKKVAVHNSFYSGSLHSPSADVEDSGTVNWGVKPEQVTDI
ncbi:hypothetical protein J6590_106534 [Homalodisca vitripennis]|nr:hypothetical protein J6590_106534 [Homalodisca vitripennis]